MSFTPHAPQKQICPKCKKLTFTVWPAVGGMPGRKQCTNDACQYKERG